MQADQDLAGHSRPAPHGLPWSRALRLFPTLLADLTPCSACQARPAGLVGVCPACAAAITAAALSLPPPVGETLWLGPYAGMWLRMVQALKYRGARRLATFLGGLLAERVNVAGWSPQLVVHVPTTRLRRRGRGYDQAELLAISVALSLGTPHAAALERTRATAKLAGQGRAARGAALASAFRSRYLAGRHVLLIDDVMTTGATLTAAKAAMTAAGAGSVTSAVVARTAPVGPEE